ncbi:M15 family metallopeptidase [Alteromonas sp. ASW11-130]|uniref:M15 family metallopeptidase n=1 Tax=Alteromonas sp. ASW11-130 TaxID=3015775 RepID=UPI0022429FD2|nr:M15 family metallopeptidase [Alteromonas sp. ASW11-130]MCW8090646.1 M15 family metallopeptidase [Alteromonas sp. ASW11-130]
MISNNEWMGIFHPHLTSLSEHHQLHSAVVGPFKEMQTAARNAGVDCQIVSSYRSFERQLSIWNRKWSGELPLLDANSEQLDHASLSANEKIDAILTWSALPGGSRHHWGTDFDVYDRQSIKRKNWRFKLVVEEYEAKGPCFGLANWLCDNASKFGFYRPFEAFNGGVAQEPWHLSHQKTAAPFEQARNCEALHNLLKESDISGKDAILIRIEELFECYVLNRGKV